MIAQVAAALLGLALAAALVELGARALLRRRGGYYRYKPYCRERHEIDREALPGLSPIAEVEINGDGERGDPPPGADERAFRALVVGGSAAECYYLDQRQTWAAVVQRELGRPGALRALGASRAHVGNVARAILTCEHLDRMLQQILPRYRRLDAVIIMVGAADLVSWMERGLPGAIPEDQLDLSKIFEQHPEVAWRWAPRRTALWRLLGNLNRRLRHPVVRYPQSGGWLHRVRRMRAEAPRRIDDVPDATPMLDHFARHLAALIQTARTRASLVLVVRQPWIGARLVAGDEAMMWNFGVGRPYREQVTTYFTPRVVDALMRLIDARAAAVAEAEGVAQVDLMPVLPRALHDRDVFYDYLHFTPEGAELVGRVVAEAILASR